MTIKVGDRVLDFGLSALDTDCDKLFVCSAQPTDYADAVSKKLGEAAVSIAGPGPSTGGREITVPAITAGTVTAAGTVSHWAAVDTVNSRLLATGTVTGGKVVATTQNWTLATFKIRLAGAAGGGGTSDLTTGLVSEWHINEDSGATNCIDYQSSHTLVLERGDQWNGSGDLFVNGHSSWFAGGNTYGSVANHADYNITTYLAVFLWVHGVQDDGQGDYSFLLSKWDWQGTLGNSWMIKHGNNTGKMIVHASQSGGAAQKQYVGSQTVFDGAWHSIGIRMAAGVLSLFCDGVKDTSPTLTRDDAMTAIDVSTCPIFFALLSDGTGGPANSAFFKTFQGAIRGARIYNTLKSDAFFAAAHAAGIP